METLIKVTLPYPIADLQAIERRLSACDAIVHYDPDFPRYSIAAYHHDAALHKHRYYALFDLNVLSAVLAISKGVPATESMRNAAALMAFLMSFDCIVEPGMCAQEYSSLNGEAQTQEKIRLFRQADNLHPSMYSDIACDRRHTISLEQLPDTSGQTPDAFHMHIAEPYWQHYAALLKLGILLNSAGDPIDKLHAYMKWQRDEYFFGACNTILAIQSLGPQPISDPLKQSKRHRGGSPLDGVRNAAWDLSIAKYWSERVFHDHDKNVQWLFCSFDASLRELAHHIIVSNSLKPKLQLRRIVQAHWPNRMVESAIAAVSSSDSARDDRARRQRVRETKERIRNIIAQLESEFTESGRQSGKGRSLTGPPHTT